LAVPQAHRFFAEYERKPINGPMLSNLIRYYALEYLKSRKHNAHEEPIPDSWGMRGLSNNGIELLYKRSCIRIRKGSEPPFPATDSSQEFYQQVFNYEDAPGYSGILTNLLVLWDLGTDQQFSGLKLVRPVDGGIKFAKWDWLVAVPKPVLSLDSQVSAEYMHAQELPLDPSESYEREDDDDSADEGGPDKTGTDNTQ
jgi:hypothetical protein